MWIIKNGTKSKNQNETITQWSDRHKWARRVNETSTNQNDKGINEQLEMMERLCVKMEGQ